MTGVPKWGVVAASAAPIALIGGWTLAAHLQPRGYDSVSQTISSLAALGTPDRAVMTVALLVTGGCQIATALALRPAALPGRLLLAAGGLSVVLVALNPLAQGPHDTAAHSIAATAAFSALSAWPLVSWRRGPGVPWGLRRRVATTAGCGLLAITGWFFVQVLAGGSVVGLAERVVAAGQTLWPLVVTGSAVAAARRVVPAEASA